MDVKESETEDYVLLSMANDPNVDGAQPNSLKYLSEIDDHVEDLHDALWPLNKVIHDHPELAFNENKAHDALIEFMRSRNDWVVTPHAFGLNTAWIAIFDTGRGGPAVSFNAEMGK